MLDWNSDQVLVQHRELTQRAAREYTIHEALAANAGPSFSTRARLWVGVNMVRWGRKLQGISKSMPSGAYLSTHR